MASIVKAAAAEVINWGITLRKEGKEYVKFVRQVV
jgi:hypothetical protein